MNGEVDIKDLVMQYRDKFGYDIPDGMIDSDTLARLIEVALSTGRPISDTSDFVD